MCQQNVQEETENVQEETADFTLIFGNDYTNLGCDPKPEKQ